mmetsp:Transcript_21952/g.32074  ORF Transcript_21952/g.32074 Transcript_21952/m.32074 type:complete len:139 (+) Transcript_21952:44-460(+)
MVSLKIPSPKSPVKQYDKYTIYLVKLLFVLLLLLLLPKLVSTKGAAAKRRRRLDKQFRILKRDCEESTSGEYKCGTMIYEENMSCVSACVSQACHEDIYAGNLLEDGEVDFHRARVFENCVKREIRAEKRKGVTNASR